MTLKAIGTRQQFIKGSSKIIFIFLLLPAAYCLLPLRGIHAEELSSQNYRIQGANLNMTSGNKTSTNFKLSDVVGQTAAGLFASKGFIVEAGFLNGAAGSTFSFTVSPLSLDFGNLTPNTPVEKNIKIKISNGNSPGYTVRVSENQPLSTTAQAEIPDTICDLPTNPCTQAGAAKWISTTIYGFGYKMNGRTIPVDFLKDGFFRPFPASRRNEQQALIMQSQAKKVKDDATMTVRVNVGPNQPVGQYRNVLTFTALAGI
jgi:hypothetical protein